MAPSPWPQLASPPVTSPVSGVATARCLVVDDDDQVRHAIARVIEGHGLATLEAASGDEALTILEREGGVPLVISDIHMAGMDGVSFLREALGRYPEMAVVMLSGVSDVATAVECLKLGAMDYIAKPVIVEEVRARVDKALEKRDLLLQNRFYQRHLESRVRELDRRNRQSMINGVKTLVHALEAKDAYTSGHSARVSRYAVQTAVRLGYTGDLLDQIRLGGELHDIGKIGTREDILHKPAPLSTEEFDHIQEHTVLGEKILSPFLSESPMVLRIVRHHHERMEGGGFPDALKGEDIPREARVVAVVDAFDAMTTNRAYRQPRTPLEAVDELRRCAGPHFDPEVVEAFLTAYRDVSALPLPI
jgi:putative two-component system response regulator